ncbi:hypothetical protein [Sphingomonas sp.]|uniref:hypothetical protein n=1 Tax=Sphingomonas sp. TaxID=28214 RepID=UPI001B28B655|nr:hypothetical protein [Sphingomonas sp.]MBO9712178.1 hypothetical protein [Sphingomonas sp.]
MLEVQTVEQLPVPHHREVTADEAVAKLLLLGSLSRAAVREGRVGSATLYG